MLDVYPMTIRLWSLVFTYKSLISNLKSPNFTLCGCKIGCLCVNYLLILHVVVRRDRDSNPGYSQYNGFQDRAIDHSATSQNSFIRSAFR